MKGALILLLLASTISLQAQPLKAKSSTIQTKTEQRMDISKITNPQVKQAIEALQNNDKNAWFSFFTNDAVFTDDGRIMDFTSFFDNAFKHKEKFLTIDKVENNGKDIFGNFFAGQWGTFKVYFKFHQQADGKLNRLDIGQSK
ncbi:MAG: hypothetical protein H3C45_10630 [Bacteroidia bacterium]|nr:hypothetical protein [Bacteroidia bacterium]